VVIAWQQHGSSGVIIAAVAVEIIFHSSSRVTAAATVFKKNGGDSVGIIAVSLIHQFIVCKFSI